MQRNPRFTSRSVLSIFLSLLLCLLVIPLAPAQSNTTGAVEGQILDDQGQPVAGVVVQFINEATQFQTAIKTNSNGSFVKYQLQPGAYTVRVKVPGFKEVTKTQGVFITRKREVLPPIRLERESAGAVTMPTPTNSPENAASPGHVIAGTSTPLASPALAAKPNNAIPGQDAEPEEGIRGDINTTDGRREGAYTQKEVSTLPLGAVTLVRTFDEFALLLPGVAPPPQTQGDVAGPGVGAGVGSAGQFAVNGLRSRANNFTVDGSDNNDEDIGVRRQGFLALVPQPVESIKEYHVTTLLAPAQYGRNIGAQVDAVSRSGGNSTHGTIFGFLNTSQLNSRDFFDTSNGNAVTALRAGNNQPVLLNNAPLTVRNESGGKDSFTLGQGGFVLGGPLVAGDPNKPKSRSLFYFVSAEGHILNATKEANFAVPTVEQRGAFGTGASGLFFNPLTCQNFSNLGTCTGGALDFYFPTALQGDAVFSLFPFPNNPTGVYGRNTLTQTLPAGGQSKIASGKFDANFGAFGAQHQLAGRYNFTDDFRDIPVTGGAIFSSLRPNVRTQNFSTILNSQITNTVSNEFRASYGRTRLDFEQLRRPEQLRSSKLPNEPFLLNAPYLVNNTLPQCSIGGGLNTCFSRGGRIVANTGSVVYNNQGTTERGVAGSNGFIQDGALGPVGQVVIAGFSSVGVDVFNFPQRRVNNTYQVADSLFLPVGSRHRLAFGTDIRRAELNSDLPRNARSLITFNGAPRLRFDTNPTTGAASNFRFNGFFNPVDLAAAQAASGTFQTLIAPGSSSTIGLRYYELYFFGQDEWRVRPNLSLSYGLRYEYTTPAREVHRSIESTFNSPAVAQLLPNLQRFIAGRTSIFDPDHNNFAPRLGIAYSPRPSTTIRAGYGWFYDQIIGAVISQSRSTFPNFLTLNTGGGINLTNVRSDTYPNGIGFNIFNTASPTNGISAPNASLGAGCFRAADGRIFCPYTIPNTLNSLNSGLPPGVVVDVNRRENPAFGFGVTLPAKDLSTPMAQHYSVTVEQQLGAKTVVSAAYVGTQGRHLLRFTTPNLGSNVILLPVFFDQTSSVPDFSGVTLAPGARVDQNGNIVGGRPTGGGVGAVNIFETTANSRYDALQVQVRGRFVRRFQYQANYTFSKVEDDVSDVFELAGASALPQNSLTRAGERADANFDVRHRAAYNLIYTLPNFSHESHAVSAIFGGLELASTGQFQTGQPFTVNSIFDVNLDGNLTDRLNSTSSITRTGNRQQPLVLQSGIDPTSLLAAIGQDGSVPRNSFRASNLLLFNLAVAKHIRIKESKELLFRTEFFNLTNRANFGIPIRFLEAPGFGQATDTVTPGRRIQFVLKLSF